MVTERHYNASRLLIRTLSKGEFGGKTIFTDIGQQSLVLPAHLLNTSSQQDLTPITSTKSVSR